MPPRSALQPPPDAVLAAAGSLGVFRRMDLVDRHGEARVRAQLTAGRWQSPTASVVVHHNGPLTPAQRVWATLLSGPPGSLLHGLTAAQYDGFRGFHPDGIAIVVPGGSRSRRHPRLDLPAAWNVTIRWSTKLGVEDVRRTAQPPRTRLARSLVDAASERVGERRARAIIISGVQQQIVRTPTLWNALSRRGRCRNRAIIAEAIADAAGGIQSLPEQEFALIVRRLGLPEPERQRILQTQGGTFYLDNAWTLLGIRAEIHGIPHRRIAQWDEDLLRQNDITIETGGLLVFSSYAVRHQADRVAGQLRRMFERRGWRPAAA